MRSIKQIRCDADDAGQKAMKAGRIPRRFTKTTLRDKAFCAKIPYLGSYVPSGWYLKEAFFVDAFGAGGDGGSAMSITSFLKQLTIGLGYAVIETGQFQIYVGSFVKE